jgi:hypothetical protein
LKKFSKKRRTGSNLVPKFERTEFVLHLGEIVSENRNTGEMYRGFRIWKINENGCAHEKESEQLIKPKKLSYVHTKKVIPDRLCKNLKELITVKGMYPHKSAYGNKFIIGTLKFIGFV